MTGLGNAKEVGNVSANVPRLICIGISSVNLRKRVDCTSTPVTQTVADG